MKQRERLEDDLRRTLRAKADDVAVDVREFEPTRLTRATDATAGERRPTRARWTVLIAALLVVVVGVAALVARAARSSDHSVRVISPATTVPTTPAAGPAAAGVEVDSPVVAPTWVPPGEQLWSFATRRGNYDGSAFLTQLIGLRTDGGALQSGIYLEFQATDGSGIPPGQENTTVRGAPARVSEPKDAPGATTAIDWFESGASITAITRGLSTADAETLLAQLHPVGGALAQTGFAATSVPAPYQMLGTQAPATTAENTTAVLGYWMHTPAAGSLPDIFVSTSRRYTYPGYLRTAIGASFDGDGVAMSYDPWHGGTVVVAMRDGRQIAVSSPNGAGLPRATLERIARRAVLVNAARADEMRREVDDRLQRLPAIGSAKVPLGTVTLRGSPSAVTVCLEPEETRVSCAPIAGADAYTPSDGGRIAGGVVTPSGWVVYVATKTSLLLDGVNPQVGSIGDYRILVAPVPRALDLVAFKQPQTNPNFPSLSIGDLTRPQNG